MQRKESGGETRGEARRAATIPDDVTLPETGGPSLLVPVAGSALVVGGASLIRTGRSR